MKSKFKIPALLMSCVLFFSFMAVYEPNETTAEVKKIDGISIFADCKPVKDYEVLGEVELSYFSFSNGSKAGKIQTKLVGKAKEKFPSMQGIIYNIDGESASVIKFK